MLAAERALTAPVGEASLRTRAGSRLGLFLALGAVLTALAPRSAGVPLLLAYNLLVACAFAWDRARLLRAVLRVTRPPVLRCQAHGSVPYALELELEAGPSMRLTLAESPPLGFTIAPLQQASELAPGLASQLSLTLSAERHGKARLSHVYVRRESLLGLSALVEAHPCASELAAYPRLPLRDAPWATLARQRLGSAPQARTSAAQGGEIEQLREYVATDPMRIIDWKASAKRRRPISRSYQPERSQTLWLVLDASRAMMAASEADTDGSAVAPTRFERALEAALLLASAALTQGDQVGLLIYGRALRVCVPPRRGRAQLFALIEAIMHVHPEPCELDAAGLLTTFAQAAPKRCLFVLFTELENGTDLEQLAGHAPLVTRRHLALCLSLSGRELTARLRAPIESERDAYLRVAAIKLQEERESLKRKLYDAGMPVIECAPAAFAGAAVAEYQRQKRSGRL